MPPNRMRRRNISPILDEGPAPVEVVLEAEAIPETPVVVPPRPELDPMLGDQTPAYKNWLRRFYPEAYEKKFGEVAR
jgi:hypothetical protein